MTGWLTARAGGRSVDSLSKATRSKSANYQPEKVLGPLTGVMRDV